MRKNAIVTIQQYKELNEAISERLFKGDENTKRYAPEEPYLFKGDQILLPITDEVQQKCGDLIKDLKYEE